MLVPSSPPSSRSPPPRRPPPLAASTTRYVAHRLDSIQDSISSLQSQVKSLLDSNASLSLSMTAMKAASEARDQEVHRLQSELKSQQDINSQLLSSLTSLHQKMDALPEDQARTLATFAGWVKRYYLSAAEGEKRPDIFTSDRPGPSDPSKATQADPSVQGEQITKHAGALSEGEQSEFFKKFEWCKKKLIGRISISKIVKAKLATHKESKENYVILTRADDTVTPVRFSELNAYGVSELHEITDCLEDSQSPNLADINVYLRGLFEYVTKIKTGFHQTIFQNLAANGIPPNSKNLNLKPPSLPKMTSPSLPHKDGIFFNNAQGTQEFFRKTETSIADSSFLEAILLTIPDTHGGTYLQRYIIAELQERKK